MRGTPRSHLSIAIGVVVLLVVLLRTAWVCDDAYFTFRTVENWLAGHGPRWNIADRAQAYTHPLWLLLLTALSGVTGRIEGSAMGLGICCGLGTFLVLAWGRRPTTVAFIALALAGSKPWTDFATSGLENSLSGLLIAGFARLWFTSHERMASVGMLLGGLLVLNRLDLAVLVLPPMLLWTRREARYGPLVLAALPVLCWLAFALVYYGTLLPNSALAKLALGVPRTTLLQHGLWTLVQPLQLDWITVPLLALGLGLAMRSTGRSLAVGGMLYLLYVVWIGGDFMSGRFHVAPYVLAISLLADPLDQWPVRRMTALTLVVAAAALASPRSPLLSGPSFGSDEARWSREYSPRLQVLDERAFYYQDTGLLSAREPPMPAPRFTARRRVEFGVFGRIPYEKGPLLHQVDRHALGDPFLARMPVRSEDLEMFRAGHAGRITPFEYMVSWERGGNLFTSPVLRPLYADVRLATQAPLLTPGRGGAIARLLVHDLKRFLRGAPLVPPEAIRRPFMP